MRAALRNLVCTGLLLAPGLAEAQLFSPGKLSKPHGELEGLSNCTKCHPAGGKLSAALCLDCHDVLKTRVEAREGLHGRLPPDERDACQTCHVEHEGRTAPLVDWDRKAFDHERTGYTLRDAHARADCESCHEPRLVRDRAVTRLVRETGRESFLGLGDRCRDCHFDEHRGQLDRDCAKCHDERAFDPAPKFDHDDSDFALKGKHRDAECQACHPDERDTKTRADAFPAPARPDFARYAPLEHDGCIDCHEDVHDGRFGRDCAQCHDESGWKTVSPTAIRDALESAAFHDDTRYPLRGAHRTVDCDSCHRPLGQRGRVFAGLAFDRCDRCHLDAHDAQVEGDCDRCHDLQGFLPTTFGLAAHDETEFGLDGAHQAVACGRCHEDATEAPRPPRRWARALKRRKRPFLASAARLDLPERACRECHADPHEGQFADRVDKEGCVDCHRAAAWTDVTLDHDTETAFPLEGAHERAACATCHVRPTPEAPVAYRPVDQACDSCHLDVHYGQFATEGATTETGRTDCARCHGNQTFDIEAFDHDRTRFALGGRHADVACDRCHVRAADGPVEVTRYRPLPTDCAGCHADFHDGAFDDLLPPSAASVVPEPASPPAPPAHAAAATDCARCHAPSGWRPAAFDHARVGWALEGRHAEARCASCHGADLHAPRDRACGSCHADPHRGELGLDCAGCHEQTAWTSRFDATAHRSTAFPLSGAHAVVPCEECHTDAFGRGFTRAAAGCERCHGDDYEATRVQGLDHVEAGFDRNCQRCHTTTRFTGARFAAHDACFAITGGPHAGITCQNCHDSLQGARVTGQCDTGTARCTSCHEHDRNDTDDEHRNVPGYAYEDRKCYECHRFAP